LIEAAKRGLDLSVGCELAAFGLRETFEYIRQVRRIDRLGLAFVSRHSQHGARNLILRIGRQATYRFEGLF
jgi:hypothetical protein